MIRYIELDKELDKATEMLNATDFKLSSKIMDCEYVKWCKKVDHVVEIAKANDFDPLQAVYHWHTYVCNQALLEMFYDYGCKPLTEDRNTRNCILLNGTLLNVAVLMAKNTENFNSLTSRTGKDEYLRKSYQADIERGFTTPKNRLFVMVSANDVTEYRKKKTDFGSIASKVYAFVNYYRDKELNSLDVNGTRVYADIILV